MVEINLTIVIQVIQFLILVFILNRVLFRPISQVINERQQKITALVEDARSLGESIRTKLENYENRLQKARIQARNEQEEMSQEIKEQEEENLRAVSEEANRIVASTQKALEDTREQLRLELRQQAEEMSLMLAEKVLGRRV